ncbi:MAG: hypothetical protein ACK41T_03725 [Pseudobdellovibrio sp.]
MDYAKDFLKVRSIEDACVEVIGELPDVTTALATYWYGNREVIVSPADETQDGFVMHVDIYNGRAFLVEG